MPLFFVHGNYILWFTPLSWYKSCVKARLRRQVTRDYFD